MLGAFEASEPVRGPLLFRAVVVVAVRAGPGIPRCWRWVPCFVQGLCLRGVVAGIVIVHYGSLPLDYCQWIGLQWLVEGSREVVMVVHIVVLPAILRNERQIQNDCRA